MKIRRLEDIGAEAWNAVVGAAPEGSFFHLAEWEPVIRQSFGFDSHYLAVEDTAGLVGVLPLFIVKRGPFGTALMSTPLCMVGGAVAVSPEAAAFLERAAIDRAKALGADYVELRNAHRRLDTWTTHEQFYAFRRPILETEEANLKAIPKRQRADVRKALALGLTASTNRDLNLFYTLYADSMHRMGTPAYPKKYMQSLLTAFGERVEIIVAHNDAEPVCAMLCFHFNNQTLPYYAGAAEAAYSSYAYSFTLWSVVQRGFELGFDTADFGRSIRGTGSFNFKKNWGMESQPLNYQTYLVKGRAHPNMDPASLRFRVFSNTWRRLPRFVVDGLSPMASRLVV